MITPPNKENHDKFRAALKAREYTLEKTVDGYIVYDDIVEAPWTKSDSSELLLFGSAGSIPIAKALVDGNTVTDEFTEFLKSVASGDVMVDLDDVYNDEMTSKKRSAKAKNRDERS